MNIDPKLTITRDAAMKLVPTLVAYVESKYDMDLWEKVNASQAGLRKGQPVIVAIKDPVDRSKATYVQAKVSSVNHHDICAVDGPVVRVKAGTLSWRVDGNDPFHPVTSAH
jgi:lactam utilization protein B